MYSQGLYVVTVLASHTLDTHINTMYGTHYNDSSPL